MQQLADELSDELARLSSESADLDRALHPIGGEGRRLFLDAEMRLRQSMLLSLDERGVHPHS